MRTLFWLVLLCLAQMALAEDAPKAPEKPPEKSATLKLVTYNVLADFDHLQRVPVLFDLLADSDADIIVLQEVSPWFFQAMYDEKWLKKYHLTTEDDKNVGRGEYLILSKRKLKSAVYKTLPGNQRRGVLVAKLNMNGRNLAVATVHMESLLEDGPTRAAQLDTIFPLLADADDAIFLGDFNFGDGEQPDTDHLDKKYVDVWREMKPKDPGYTWNIEVSDMAKNGSFPKETSRRIDRVLVRSNVWKPEVISIIGDKPVTEGNKAVFPSDHFGLSATLKFKE